MTLTPKNEFRVTCDVCCEACDWIEANTIKEAELILKTKTNWKKYGKKHVCSDCAVAIPKGATA